MKIQEKFNLRDAKLVESSLMLTASPALALGIRVMFTPIADGDYRNLALHLTPDEAIEFAQKLLSAAILRKSQ